MKALIIIIFGLVVVAHDGIMDIGNGFQYDATEFALSSSIISTDCAEDFDNELGAFFWELRDGQSLTHGRKHLSTTDLIRVVQRQSNVEKLLHAEFLLYSVLFGIRIFLIVNHFLNTFDKLLDMLLDEVAIFSDLRHFILS